MRDICLQNISKSFDAKPVLSHFSARFPAGETACVMGSSGCGKTTLLRILLGLLPPDDGTVEGVPDKAAVVFQEDRLCEDFPVLANLRLMAGRPARESVLAHLAQLGLAENAAAPVSSLSGGMKRRVALARAMLYDAPLVVLDEPFKGLDDKTKAMAIAYVLSHTAGKTLIAVTHDPAEAAALGGSLIKMS